MDRSEIERALTPIFPAVVEFFNSGKYEAPPGEWPDTRFLDEIGKPVVAAFRQQPEFSDSTKRQYIDVGGVLMTFTPGLFLTQFLEFVVKRGTTQAFDWIDKVLATKSADARCVCPIFGLSISEPVSFGNGKFQLIRFDDLPASYHKAAEQAKARLLPVSSRILADSVLVANVHVSKFLLPSGENAGLRQTLNELHGLVDMLAVGASHQASYGMGWVEYVDPELQAAQRGRTWCGGNAEIKPSMLVKSLENEAIWAFAEAYLQLPSAVMDIVNVANSRLNQAMRRHQVIDKSVDAAIGLEVLLGDRNDKNEISDRLSRRAAILIGGTLAERKQTKAAVRELYNIRSKVVHTGRPPRKVQEAKNATDAGIQIGISVVRAIVSMRGMPPWEEWELMGRQ